MQSRFSFPPLPMDIYFGPEMRMTLLQRLYGAKEFGLAACSTDPTVPDSFTNLKAVHIRW